MSAVGDLSDALAAMGRQTLGPAVHDAFAEAELALLALQAEHARTRDVLAPDVDTSDTPLDELAKAALHARQFDDERVVKFADGPGVPIRGRQSAINYAESFRAERVEHRGGECAWEAKAP